MRFNDLPTTTPAACCSAACRCRAGPTTCWPASPYADRRRRSIAARRRGRRAQLTDEELEAALSGHPRIGERADAGARRRPLGGEQAGVDPAAGDTAARLAAGNAAYEERFGRVFLIRAAGRDADEILAELDRRLGNDDDDRARRDRRQPAPDRAAPARRRGLMSTLSHPRPRHRGRAGRPRASRSASSPRDGDVLGRGRHRRRRPGRRRSARASSARGDYVLRFDTGALRRQARLLPRGRRRLHGRRRPSTTTCPLLLSPYGYSTYRGS